MRILIVDDELVSRTKMKTIVESFGECRTAENGRQALDQFQQAANAGEHFHLVTLDIEMPDMAGTAVLQRMRRLESDKGIGADQRAKIVMVTSQSDQHQVITCLQGGCDDYIAKPFDIHLIEEKLAKLGLRQQPPGEANSRTSSVPRASGAMAKDINAVLRSGQLNLPVHPNIGKQFLELQRAKADIGQVSGLVKQDMAIVAHVFKTAYSDKYSGSGDVENFELAFGRLGLDTASKLITSMINQDHYATSAPKYREFLQRLWRHSLATGFAADILSQFLSDQPAMDAFTAGLLHDIGALALMMIIAEMDRRGGFETAITIDTLKDTIDGLHVPFGKKLLQKWRFAPDVVDALRHHRRPVDLASISDGALVVRLANQVTKSAGYVTFPEDPNNQPVETLSTPKLNLKPEQLQLVRQKVTERMQRSAMGY